MILAQIYYYITISNFFKVFEISLKLKIDNDIGTESLLFF